MKTKVFIADDHDIVREGIKAVISRNNLIQVVGEANTSKELLIFARHKKADVYIIDINLSGSDGIEILNKLIKNDSGAKVIFLSIYDDRNTVIKAFNSGCRGYVTKVRAAAEIVEAVNKVNCGGYFISDDISEYIFDMYSNKVDENLFKNSMTLSSKEKEVLKFIAEGKSSKEISGVMGISYNTVNVHRNNIMQKLDRHKTAELVRYAIKERIISL
ncbi:MAG: response regulator [Thermodesulfobacteriota bacterium]